MLAYGGNITAEDGKPLFRGAIMESGAPTPAGPASRGQNSYDTLVNATNCTTGGITCLRALSAGALLNATNLLPNLNSVSSLSIPFLPREDGTFVPSIASELVANRQYAQNVSIISGNQWDEGTLLTLGTGLNITTTEALDNWLATTFSPNSTAEQRSRLLELYPEDVTQGSPFDTGNLYALAPQSKRIGEYLFLRNLDLSATLTLCTLQIDTVQPRFWVTKSSKQYVDAPLCTIFESVLTLRN